MPTLLVAALFASPANAQEVRAIQLSPDAPALDMYVNGEAAVSDLRFTEGTTSTRLDPGNHTLTFTPTGESDKAYSYRVPVREGATTTTALIGGAGNVQPVTLLRADHVVPRAMAHVDIVHAAEGLEAMSFTVGRIGSPAGTVAFGETLSSFLPSVDTRIGIDADLDGHPDFDFDLRGLREGAQVDLFITQARDGRPGIVAWYADGTIERIGSNFVAPSFLRVAHLSPDAPMIDAYVDGELVASDLDFTELATELRVNAGYRHVALTVAGSDEVVLDTELDIGPGTKTTVFAYGTADNLMGGTVDARDDVELEEGRTLMQVFHAADSLRTVNLFDMTARTRLRSGLDYGTETGFRHSSGAWTLGIDLDRDRMPDAMYDIPDLGDTQIATVFAVSDANGPFLQVYLDDGSSMRIDRS